VNLALGASASRNLVRLRLENLTVVLSATFRKELHRSSKADVGPAAQNLMGRGGIRKACVIGIPRRLKQSSPTARFVPTARRYPRHSDCRKPRSAGCGHNADPRCRSVPRPDPDAYKEGDGC
jgi:hypothetical protein